MKKYGWAVNEMKLQRAIAQATKNQTPNEKSIKELYISMGGLLVVNKNKVMENEEVLDTVEETVEVTPEVEETTEVIEETNEEEVTPDAE